MNFHWQSGVSAVFSFFKMHIPFHIIWIIKTNSAVVIFYGEGNLESRLIEINDLAVIEVVSYQVFSYVGIQTIHKHIEP